MQGFPYWEDVGKLQSLPKFPNPLPPLGGDIYPTPL